MTDVSTPGEDHFHDAADSAAPSADTAATSAPSAGDASADDANADDASAATLTPEQGRVLGCLIEKARTTPDDYPLTANALMRACNQSTSRDPVVNYDLRTIERVVAELKTMKLVRFVHMATGRAVTKYRHVADETWEASEAEMAVLAMLMLRGAQTVPELKARTERLHSFGSLNDVLVTLEALASRPEGWVVRLDRQIGQREDRWTHTLYGEPVLSSSGSTATSGGGAGARSANNERVEALEALVGALAAQVQKLTTELAEVRSELGLDEA